LRTFDVRVVAGDMIVVMAVLVLSALSSFGVGLGEGGRAGSQPVIAQAHALSAVTTQHASTCRALRFKDQPACRGNGGA
jgi:hypothetical protein